MYSGDRAPGQTNRKVLQKLSLAYQHFFFFFVKVYFYSEYNGYTATYGAA